MKPLIIANWKMNPQTLTKAKQLFNSIKKGLKNIKNACPELSRRVEVVICPPFVWLPILGALASARRRTSSGESSVAFGVGGQNCFWEEKGPFTGEISPLMLKNLGCKYVIIGHSERRKLGETDEMINKKIKVVLKSKLKPILCVGETERERKAGKTFQILKTQIKNDLRDLIPNPYYLKPLILAYEPVWAVGTGNPCDPLEAKKVLLFLRNFFKKQLILYGGSVNSKNAIPYIKKAQFQGFIIGGASLRAKEFIEILKRVNKA